jgi:hypothetical protein
MAFLVSLSDSSVTMSVVIAFCQRKVSSSTSAYRQQGIARDMAVRFSELFQHPTIRRSWATHQNSEHLVTDFLSLQAQQHICIFS